MAAKQPHLSHPEYRPDIDGLRAMAVLAVVAFHAFPYTLKGGFIGVDIFFVISGYLISTIIFENMARGTFRFTEFYARRIKRIFPALIVVLASCLAFGWFALLGDEYRQLGRHTAAGAGFVANLVLWNEAGYFDNTAETKPLLHLWSLGIEEQFYIVWPLLLWFAYKCKFNFALLAIAVAATSFALNIKGAGQDTVATFYSPQTRFWELLSGSLLAWVTLRQKNSAKANRLPFGSFGQNPELQAKLLANILSVTGFLLLAYGFLRINKQLNFPGYWAALPVLGAVLIISGGPKAWLNRTLLTHKVAIWFGLISYPLYLWHWPLLSFARIVESEEPQRNLRISLILAAVLLAWLTCKFIERPIRFGRHGKAGIITLLALMTALGTIGYTIEAHNGYESRETIKDYVEIKKELVRTPPKDNACLQYIGNSNPLFPYCRFSKAGAGETVAVIGDSHAHVAYPGIAEYLKAKGINTVLLANSSCPPFQGITTGLNHTEKNACQQRIEQLISTVLTHNDIKKVLLFTRGTSYATGTEPFTKSRDLANGELIPITELAKAAQLTVDNLVNHGKTVIYVTENPELAYSAESCLQRPFKSNTRNCTVEKTTARARQAEYLQAFTHLHGATVINSLDYFCPDNTCRVFDENGSLLYADDDHLSVAGSRFQVKKFLKQYLD